MASRWREWTGVSGLGASWGDYDNDGRLTRREWNGDRREFDVMDVNNDGWLTYNEYAAPMDNDVRNTEYCIGFSTAISRASDAINRQRTTVGSHERIGIFRVFGRDAGYTSLYTAYVTSIRCGIPDVNVDVDGQPVGRTPLRGALSLDGYTARAPGDAVETEERYFGYRAVDGIAAHGHDLDAGDRPRVRRVEHVEGLDLERGQQVVGGQRGEQVPGDRLALAIRVGGEDQLRGVLHRRLQRGRHLPQGLARDRPARGRARCAAAHPPPAPAGSCSSRSGPRERRCRRHRSSTTAPARSGWAASMPVSRTATLTPAPVKLTVW